MDAKIEKRMYQLSFVSVIIYTLCGAIYAFNISFVKGICVLLAIMVFLPILFVVYKNLTENL